MKTKNTKCPCVNCKYFATCGDILRTEKCNGKEVGDDLYIGRYPDGTPIKVVSNKELLQKIDK